MCNIGDRPAVIAQTYQFMILQQVTELFVLYFTGQSSSLIPMQATIKLFDRCSLHILLYVLCVCWGIVLEYHIGCTIPEVSAVHVCITPHSINVTLIVKVILVWMDPCLTRLTLGPLHVLLCFCFYTCMISWLCMLYNHV